MRLILLLRGVESSQEADGIHQGATDMSATKGTFREVWAGLNETSQGWGGSRAVTSLVLKKHGGGQFLELSAQLPIRSLGREQSHHPAGRELGE